MNSWQLVRGLLGLTLAGTTSIGLAQNLITSNTTIHDSLCVGFDCLTSESYGADTIRLKENNLRIHFDDTSASGFPLTDWRITINSDQGGGASFFSIDDATNARTPFLIEANTPTNALYVDDSGNVGLGTNAPVLDLHVRNSNTPGIRLEQDNGGGFTPQTWDVAGNEAGFFIRDVTAGSRLPLRILPGAPSNSLVITSAGRLGVGTLTPEQDVDVQRSTAPARFQLTSFTNTAGEAPQYIQRRARGTSGAPAALLDNDNLGLFSFRGHNGTAMGGSRATITAQAAGNFTGASTPTKLIFATTPVGSTAPQQVLVITEDGKLQVNGLNLNVPDYVFEDDYQLMPLDELRSFIDQNGHLPGIANAKTVASEGLDLAGAQMGLLQKVEELTLYTLQQEDRLADYESLLAAQQERMESQEALLAAQQERVAQLEAMLRQAIEALDPGSR